MIRKRNFPMCVSGGRLSGGRLSGAALVGGCLTMLCVAFASATVPADDGTKADGVVAVGDAPKERVRVGDRLPLARIRTADDLPVRLSDIVEESPIVLVLYRGGWCPYCTRHLAELGTLGDRFDALGFRTIAVSPDRPERIRETRETDSIRATLLSDADMVLATALGLAFRVDDQTMLTYERYGIDLAAASGRDHRLLPVPAVYLIDRDGTIRFVHHDPDYRQRLSGAAILSEAERMSADKGSP